MTVFLQLYYDDTDKKLGHLKTKKKKYSTRISSSRHKNGNRNS